MWGWGFGKPYLGNSIQVTTFLGHLTERDYSGKKEKDGLLFLYGRGRGALAMVRADAKKYDVLILKNNNVFGHTVLSTLAAALNAPTPEKLFAIAATYAQQRGISKSVATGISEKDLIKLFLNKEGMSTVMFKFAFPEIHSNLGDSEGALQASCFKVIGASSKDEARIQKILTKAASILKSHGFGYLCYGEVILASKGGTKRTLLADYAPDTDQIRITLKSETDDRVVRTAMHELGHRLYHKFKLNRPEIERMFQEVKKDRPRLQVGHKVRNPKSGEVLVITAVEFARGKLQYRGNYEHEANRPAGLRSTWRAGEGISDYDIVDGPPLPPKHPFAVSSYALVNSGEFWAEVFAHAMLGRVDLLPWVKEVTS